MGILSRLRAIPHPVLFASISGSHLYGFSSPDSDVDVRGAIILPLRACCGLADPEPTISIVEGDDDLVFHDVRKLIRLLLAGNGNVAEQLASPLRLGGCDAECCERLRAVAADVFTLRGALHYRGFLTGELRELRSMPRRRLKKALYAYRVGLTGLHRLRTGELEPDLRRLWPRYDCPQVEALIERKVHGAERDDLTDAEAEQHARLVEGIDARLAEAIVAADLPRDTPPAVVAEAEAILLELRRRWGGPLEQTAEPLGPVAEFADVATVLRRA